MDGPLYRDAYRTSSLTGSMLWLSADRYKRPDMVDVDKSFPMLTIGFFEIESTSLADCTAVSNANQPGFSVSLKGVDSNDLSGTFRELI